MFVTGLLFVLCFLFRHKTQDKKIINIVYCTSAAWLLFLIIFIITNIVGGQTYLPDDGNDTTVVVLGAKIKDGYVTLVQKRRLDMAYDYLEKNPNSKCIVTGGLQSDENLVVGDVMRDYLKKRGVNESRIFVEGDAQDTYENLLYAKDIIQSQGLSNNIVIVSDNFHLLRSSWFARSIGFTNIYRLASSTPLGILPAYWFREILSMLKGFIITAYPNIFGH